MLTDDLNISLKGGYDSAFETNPLMTTIHGSLTITSGAATIDNIAIQ